MTTRKKMLPLGSFEIYPLQRTLDQDWFVQGKIDRNGRVMRMKFRVPKANSVAERESLARCIIDKLKTEGYISPEVKQAEFHAANYILVAMDELLKEKKVGVRKKTYQSYRSHLRNFNTFCGEKNIKHVSSDVAREFLRWLKIGGKVRGNTTINAHRVTLRHFFSELLSRKRVKSNPFLDTSKLRENREGAHYLTLKQIEKVKKHILEHKPFLWMPCIMQFYCFLRPSSELRFIRVADVNLDKGTIRVKSSVAKNGKQEFVKIPNPLKPYLEDLNLDDMPSDYFLIGHDGLPSEKGVSYNYWGGHFREVRKALRLTDDYKFYSFKHSGAVNFIENGGNVTELQKQLRHHSLDMTAVYLRSLGVMDIDNLGTKFSDI